MKIKWTYTPLIFLFFVIVVPARILFASKENKQMSLPITNTSSNVTTLTWGGTGNDEGADAKVDSTGNLFATGYFTGTVDFNPKSGVSQTSNGGRDVFLVKYDANHNFLWVKTWGGSGDERGDSLDIDSLGNIYITGPYQRTVDFNPIGGAIYTSNAGNANNIYLSKFDSNGNFLWVRTWGPSDGGAEGYNVVSDGANHVYVVGDFSGTNCDFNPWGGHDYHTNHPPAPGKPRLYDAFLSKFDSLGNLVWAKTWGGEGYDDSPGVALDKLGNVYVAGMYASQNINFDPEGSGDGLNHPASDSGILVDVFLSKFDSNGDFKWVRTFGGSSVDDAGGPITVDDLNNIYISGRFGCSNCDFNPLGTSSIHTTNGGMDAFVSKFDTSGNFLWAKTWGGIGWDSANGLTINNTNTLYVAGMFSNSVDFGSGYIDSHGSNDAFLSLLNTDGYFINAKTWGGIGSDSVSRLSHNSEGTIYAAGWFSDTVDFNLNDESNEHISNGGEDIFVTDFNEGTAITQSITLAGLSPTSASTVDFIVTFSEPVQNVSSSDFSLTKTGNISGASIISVTPISDSVYNVIVSTGVASGTLRLDVPKTATIYDLTGNILKGLPFITGDIYIVTKQLPDLIITNVSINPPIPTFNGSFDVVITIKNQGGSTGQASIYRDVYIGTNPVTIINPATGCPPHGDYFRYDNFTDLAPGQSDTKAVTISGGLPIGSYQLWVYVDSQCVVKEDGEINNGQ